MVEIKRNLTVPLFIKNKVRQTKYPWADLEVGDCFDIPTGTKRDNVAASISAANTKYKPKKFRRENLPDGSFRIWRAE